MIHLKEIIIVVVGLNFNCLNPELSELDEKGSESLSHQKSYIGASQTKNFHLDLNKQAEPPNISFVLSIKKGYVNFYCAHKNHKIIQTVYIISQN